MSTNDSNLKPTGLKPGWSRDTNLSDNRPQDVSLVVLGGAMRPTGEIPTVTEVVTAPTVGLAEANLSSSAIPQGVSVSSFEQGWEFKGKATINGTCTIAGFYEGQIQESEGGAATVIVTETGVLNGDIRATNVSVMGSYSGTLDASGGKVELHATSVVKGHVKYAKLQVNGADLNATLERVAERSK
jgi:cytoskeletal protein CcmA (bactofilin family)